MSEHSDIKSVINLWPTRDALRLAMVPYLGDQELTTDRIHKWASSGAVPGVYLYAFIRAAADAGFGLVAEAIVRLNSGVRGEVA